MDALITPFVLIAELGNSPEHWKHVFVSFSVGFFYFATI
jgi:hypothetical protein